MQPNGLETASMDAIRSEFVTLTSMLSIYLQ